MPTSPIVGAFARNWWVFLVQGIIAILFGIMAFTVPGLTLVTLVLLYGVYALADGIVALWVGGKSRAWPIVLAGVLGVIVGLGTFAFPGITAIALLYLIAAWAIVRGIFEIVAAVRLRKEITNEWALGLAGVLSILLGVMLMASPGAGALAMVWLIGAYSIVFGVTMIALAFRVKGMAREEVDRPRRAA